MNEAKKLNQPSSSQAPRHFDDLSHIPITSTAAHPPSFDSLGPVSAPRSSLTRSQHQLHVQHGNRLLTRILVIFGCICLFFGLGVALATAVLSGSLDLKGLAWIKDLLRQGVGK